MDSLIWRKELKKGKTDSLARVPSQGGKIIFLDYFGLLKPLIIFKFSFCTKEITQHVFTGLCGCWYVAFFTFLQSQASRSSVFILLC